MNCNLTISTLLSVVCLNIGFVSVAFADDEAMVNETAVNERIRPVVTLDDIRIAGREKPEMAIEVKQTPVDMAALDAKTDSAPADVAALGAKTYKAACALCHDTGVAGAPVVGNKAGWAARIALGVDALVVSATKGKGAMPPKGGQMQLTDDDIKAIVAYMVEQSS
ncbi:MAG: c-type cytochrome [Gammaproteobacteria bacterium]|nr:c-type cytochrome [Gammaproteobacteria bacterium]